MPGVRSNHPYSSRGTPKPAGWQRMHRNQRTETYLRSLWAGASLVDPGDLDMNTEDELELRSQCGELVRGQDHGRRTWRKV